MYIVTIVIQYLPRGGDGACVRWERYRCRRNWSLYFQPPLCIDISLMTRSTGDLQQLMNKVYTTSDKFVLGVSSTKTEVQCFGRER